MKKKIIWVSTTNKGKIAEYQKLLTDFEIKTLLDLPNYPDIEETGLTFEANALLKAKDLAKFINGIALGDDSGICVDLLDGFPGIYSKRWCYPIVKDAEISQALLDKLKQEHPNQKYSAKFQTSIALYNAIDQTEQIFTGIVEGHLNEEVIQTKDGFGYDNIFIPNGSDLTYSMIGTDEKIKGSARTLALTKLNKWMKENNEEF